MKNHEYVTQCCTNCKFMKEYDCGRKIYYCDHDDRIDDMGKLDVDDPPESSPGWCPIKLKDVKER